MDLSVIVPTLNERQGLAATLRNACAPRVREIIVVDGGSTDGTCAVAGGFATRVMASSRGRASQMNAGAAVASAEILVFLHADTSLPPGFDDAVCQALSDYRVIGGRFDVSLVPSSPLLWLTSTLMNARSRVTSISTGDQTIFVRREVFVAMGGFPEIPLMEDIEFSRALKRSGQIACLRQKVTTSSRRWRRDGVARTILLMWSLRILYFCGVPAERLCRLYGNAR